MYRCIDDVHDDDDGVWGCVCGDVCGYNVDIYLINIIHNTTIYIKVPSTGHKNLTPTLTPTLLLHVC